MVFKPFLWEPAFSFGVFLESIESEFNLTRTATSAIFSVSMLLLCVFSVLAGWAIDRYGPKVVLLLMGLFTGLSLLLTSQTSAAWQLYITYSLLLAAGTGAIYVVTMSTVSRWFDKKRGLAMGIAGSGGGLGTAVMAPFATFLISSFDWRMAYIIIGLIAWLMVIPLSLLLKKEPQEIEVLPDGLKAGSRTTKDEEDSIQPSGLSVLEALRTRSFWLMIFIWLFNAISMLLVFTHIVPHAMDIGFSAEEAAIILSVMGGDRIAGLVLMGGAADRIGKKRQLLSVQCFGLEP